MENDPLSEKLRQKERAEEDVFFAKRDRELLRKLRQIRDELQRRNIQELTYMRCPDCGARLVRVEHHGVTIEECQVGHGMWITRSELRTLARRERDSSIGRYFYRPKPIV